MRREATRLLGLTVEVIQEDTGSRLVRVIDQENRVIVESVVPQPDILKLEGGS